MQEIERRHIEGCRHHHPAAAFDEQESEVEAGTPVIQAAVDMRRRDVQKARCVLRLRYGDEQFHRRPGCRAGLPVEHRQVRFGEQHS